MESQVITFCIAESSEKHDQADEQQPTSRSASRHLKRKWTCYWSVEAVVVITSVQLTGKWRAKYWNIFMDLDHRQLHSITYRWPFSALCPFRSINWQKCGHPRGNVRIYKRVLSSPDLIVVFILFFIRKTSWVKFRL